MLSRILAGHLEPDYGQVLLEGRRVASARPGRPAPLQYAPQSPELAVDRRWTVRKILAKGTAPDPAVLAALGIRGICASRVPDQLSGGELARVLFARLFHPG
ncbi:ATP-binding cassette domain-containing protein [Sagittula stellata]|uniref:ATP-binding cassette domain-containing protein n=1 Tax=Sagittula stellata TaxID=52603 RepID=UPI000A02F39A